MSLFTRNVLFALGMTVAIVLTISYTVGYLDRIRLREIDTMQTTIGLETLSLETQFSLLESTPCDSLASSTTLSGELAELGNRLSYTENQLGSDDDRVILLKKQYYLLEIRDYIINKKLATDCKTKPVTVLYFYSNEGDCEDCEEAGYALSYLRDTYSNVRVYSFDYNLDLGALKTLIAVERVDKELPGFVINGRSSSGFSSLEEFEKRFPKGSLATSTTESN